MERADATALEAIAAALIDFVLVLDHDGLVRAVRRGAQSPSPDDPLLGADAVALVHPEDLPAALHAVDRLRAGGAERVTLRCRVFDHRFAAIIHDQDLHLIDRRVVDGVAGVVVVALVQDTRSAHPDHLYGDDFSLADWAPVGLGIVVRGHRLLYANGLLRAHLGVEGRDVSSAALPGVGDVIRLASAGGGARARLVRDGRRIDVIVRPLDGEGDHLVLVSDEVTDVVGPEPPPDSRHEQPVRAADHATVGAGSTETPGTDGDGRLKR